MRDLVRMVWLLAVIASASLVLNIVLLVTILGSDQ